MKKFLATALISTTALTSAFASPLENTELSWHFAKKEIKTDDSAKLNVNVVGFGLKFDIADGLEFKGQGEIGYSDGSVYVGQWRTQSAENVKLNYDNELYFNGEINFMLKKTISLNNGDMTFKAGMGIEDEVLKHNDEWNNLYIPFVIENRHGRFFSKMEFRYYAIAHNKIENYGELDTTGWGGTLEIGYRMMDRVSVSAYVSGKYFDKDECIVNTNTGDLVLKREFEEEALGARFTVNF